MAAPLNLITHAWMPVHRDGQRVAIRPAAIVEAGLDQRAIGWPRADFRIAQLEFLIGLLATACPPADDEAWMQWWETPPDAAKLDARFAPFADAFVLDGPGPRFMQDFEELPGTSEPVERLLIEAPGDAAVKKNSDLLVKRDRARALGRPAAAITLFTLQSWAPAGGRGNLVGLRGGGPLTTLVLPEGVSLWRTIWANVPSGKLASAADIPKIFPWCAPTRTADNDRVTTPQDVHPAQVFWGLPRRIRLDFTEAHGSCDLTGDADSAMVTGWRQRPNGTRYAGWSRQHPLSPYYRPKPKAAELLPVHGRADGTGYRDWLGLVLKSTDEARLPARCVRDWFQTRAGAEFANVPRAQLLAAGYAMDNMKAEAFVESELPLLVPATAERRRDVEALARRLIAATDMVARQVRSALRNALFDPNAKVNWDWSLLNLGSETVWQATELSFYGALRTASETDPPEDFPDPRHMQWLATLRQAVLETFDRLAPIDPSGLGDSRRIAEARKFLLIMLAGHGPAGTALHGPDGLNLLTAETIATRKAKAKRRTKGEAA